MSNTISELQNEVIDISKDSGKINHVQALLSTLKDCKAELEKCGIYVNENIETKQEEWNSYFGL